MGQNRPLTVRRYGRIDYNESWRLMRQLTMQRDETTDDELWLCEHPPVFTLGLAGKPENLLRDIGAPLVRSDRGGQITYHGPGQVVAYLLLDLKRRGLTVKTLVNRIEGAVINLLAEFDLRAERLPGAPGVYLNGAKIAALGLKVKRGCCYHGVSLNVDMDLSPYAAINPCGYEGMAVTQVADHVAGADPQDIAVKLAAHLQRQL